MRTDNERGRPRQAVPSDQLAPKLADTGQDSGRANVRTAPHRVTMDGTPGMVGEYQRRRAAVSGDRHTTPPYAGETELVLIGAAVTFPDRTLEAVLATGITPGHFYVPSNRRAWEAIIDAHAEGEPIDVHTIAARIGERATVADAITALADSSPTNAPAWAGVIVDHAKARAILPPLRAAVRAAEDGRTAVVWNLINDALDAGEVAPHVCR